MEYIYLIVIHRNSARKSIQPSIDQIHTISTVQSSMYSSSETYIGLQPIARSSLEFRRESMITDSSLSDPDHQTTTETSRLVSTHPNYRNNSGEPVNINSCRL